MHVRSTGCCGLLELVDISTEQDSTDVLVGFCQDPSFYSFRPFIIFTGVVERMVKDHVSDRTDDYGQALADFIITNNLGTVTASEARRNRGINVIRVWVWEPNYEALNQWQRAAKPISAPRAISSVTIATVFVDQSPV